MNFSEIYYYCVSIVMIAGVQTASTLNLNIDQTRPEELRSVTKLQIQYLADKIIQK